MKRTITVKKKNVLKRKQLLEKKAARRTHEEKKIEKAAGLLTSFIMCIMNTFIFIF